jgi:hypothetical protein
MASVLAVISKAAFEQNHPDARVSSSLDLDRYSSAHAGLKPLAAGGDLYLVTVRPGEALWLVGVLRAPRFAKDHWSAQRNTAPVVDATGLITKLRFATDSGITAAPGKLGMSLQTPRALTDADVALLKGLYAVTSESAPRAAAPRSQNLRTLLDLDDSFVVAKLNDFPKKDYTASGAVTEALGNVTGSGSMLLIAGCMLWVARRLEKVTDVTRCYQGAEALLCFQDSPAYFGPNNSSEWPNAPETTNDAERAVNAVSGRLWSVYTTSPGHHPLPPTTIDTAGQAVTMVRTVLGAAGKKPFEAWLKLVLERLHRFAVNPRALERASQHDKRFDWTIEKDFKKENMGPPLPPALLDPRFTPDAESLGALYKQFLGAVDWQKNPFLATPEVMAQRPFKGTPYVPTPGATYPSPAKRAGTAKVKAAKVNAVESPYPFLTSLDAMPKAQRAKALKSYLATRSLPSHFGRAELELEHAFSLMLRREVSAQGGMHVALLSVSMDVIGDLDIVVSDDRARPAALRAFEHEIDVSDQGEEAREVLLGAVKAQRLDARKAEDGDFIVVKADDRVVGRVTRAELRKVANALEPMVFGVRLTAPSDGSLFDALRYMVQQEAKPWGLSNLVDVSDFIVDVIDARLEAALEAVENRDLADELAAFSDRDGRSARAWRWDGKSFKDADHGVRRSFVAGVYDGEGVGMDFNIYRVE